jgi:hypothetical protein
MKATVKILILFLFVNFVILIAPQKAAAQVSVSFQFFYDNLSPHGYWVDNPNYGYVWVPSVSLGFIPYGSNGYWVFTNVGWTWVSNYPWGWAPFHYGRWFFDPHYGWTWVPGYEWGPGWVTWRVSDAYYGWAPIGPGISISIAYSSGYQLPYNRWTFVRDRDFGRRNIYNYYVSPSRNSVIINNSRVINNIHRDNLTRVKYNAGPDRTEVQRRTRSSISTVTLRERNKPGQSMNSRELQLYRPRIEKNKAGGREPTPYKVVRLKDVKSAVKRDVKTEVQRENRPINKSLPRQPRNAQPVKEQQIQQERQIQPQRNVQQTKDQQMQQLRNVEQVQDERNIQQTKQLHERQQRNVEQVRQQQIHRQGRQQRNDPKTNHRQN